MEVIVKKLAELVKPEKNTRIHSQKQIAEYIRSIKMFGQIMPMVIDEKNVILAGNGLYDALTQMGIETADCYVVNGLTEVEKKKLMLADNKIFNLGIDNMETFNELLKELNGDIDVPGFDADLLSVLTASSVEVDSLISNFATVSDEQKKKIEARGSYDEVPVKYQAPPVESVEVPTMNNNEIVSERAVVHEDRKYIICPKCGEKIWL